MRKSKRIWAGAVVPALILAAGAALGPGAAQAGPPDATPVGKPSPLLGAMKTELDRSFKTYGAQDPAAYFIGYTITDTQSADVSGSNGALLSSAENRNRWLQVSVRTGDYKLDNTHKVGERGCRAAGPARQCPWTTTSRSCGARSGWRPIRNIAMRRKR